MTRIFLMAAVLIAVSLRAGVSAGDESATAKDGAGQVVAAEPDSKDDAETARNQKLLAIYKDQAQAYQFMLPDRNATLALREEPVFIWLNRAKVSTVQYGAVYVWTHEGRAEVLGTIFSSEGRLYHEFHSLATGPLRAVRRSGLYWDRSDSSVEPMPLSDADPPATSSRLRLAQMRAMARRFSGESLGLDGRRSGLNLLPQPLYRMDQPRKDLVESAVFAFVSTAGTDPDVLLLIEARAGGEGLQWQYALCRFTDLTTKMFLDGNQVWSFDRAFLLEQGPKDRYRFSIEGALRLLE